jgi:phage-related tail protein
MATPRKRSTPRSVVGPAAALSAVSDVVARRLEIVGEAMANPAKADLREIALMSSEKLEAFSASAAVVTRQAGKMSAEMGQAAGEEAALAARALTEMGRATSPLGLASAQADYLMGFWSRATSRAVALNATLAAGQAAAWAPVTSAAVANAKRLKR